MPLCGRRVGKIKILMIHSHFRLTSEFRWKSCCIILFIYFWNLTKCLRMRAKPICFSTSTVERFPAKWWKREREMQRQRRRRWRRRRRTRSLAAHSAESSVFTLECQQVKVGDNTVWCCQTEFLPPNFTSSSPRPLSRLQSPPSSLVYLSLLTLIHCSRTLQFKELRTTPLH